MTTTHVIIYRCNTYAYINLWGFAYGQIDLIYNDSQKIYENHGLERQFPKQQGSAYSPN